MEDNVLIPSEFTDAEICDYFDGCADPNWKILITGPNGTGKTTFMSRLVLTSARRFDEVFVLCNTHAQSAYDNLAFKYNRFPVQESGGADINSLINELASNTNAHDAQFSVLLIVDDVPKTVFCNPNFESFVRNARHNAISIVIITHALGNVSAGVRPEFDIFMLSPSGKYTMDIVNKTNTQAADVCRQLASSIQMGATAHLSAQCYLVTIIRKEVDPSRAFYVPTWSCKDDNLLPMMLTREAYYFHTLMFDPTSAPPPSAIVATGRKTKRQHAAKKKHPPPPPPQQQHAAAAAATKSGVTIPMSSLI